MNIRLPLLAFLTAFSVQAHAYDWEPFRKGAAEIEVVDMKPVPLVESADKKGWAKVPPMFPKYGAVIYMPPNDGAGKATITVVKDGWLFIACNYDYQGNPSGNWQEEVWDEKKFKAKGWRNVTKTEMGGLFIRGDDKKYEVFMKQVKKGDLLTLRCNKYSPPYPILLTADGAKK
ncbi:MAG TPA: hypothetical protein VGO11_11780 [Chthoniobacteraceae bacterium]|nr:hypothetical protein [Chthoniobacteraceae bacterium]